MGVGILIVKSMKHPLVTLPHQQTLVARQSSSPQDHEALSPGHTMCNQGRIVKSGFKERLGSQESQAPFLGKCQQHIASPNKQAQLILIMVAVLFGGPYSIFLVIPTSLSLSCATEMEHLSTDSPLCFKNVLKGPQPLTGYG